MTRLTKPTTGLLALLLISTGSLAGCGDGPPAANKNTPATNAPKPNQGPSTPPPTTAPRPVLATSTTEWPGVEARLRNVGGRGGLLFVEVELVNTSQAPVTIENYSAETAQMTDDASKQLYEPFAQPGHPPTATSGLTQTLAPGEMTTVNASFPLPSSTELVTIVFPKIGRFDAIPLRPKTAPGAEKKGDRKADKAADAKPEKKG